MDFECKQRRRPANIPLWRVSRLQVTIHCCLGKREFENKEYNWSVSVSFPEERAS